MLNPLTSCSNCWPCLQEAFVALASPSYTRCWCKTDSGGVQGSCVSFLSTVQLSHLLLTGGPGLVLPLLLLRLWGRIRIPITPPPKNCIPPTGMVPCGCSLGEHWGEQGPHLALQLGGQTSRAFLHFSAHFLCVYTLPPCRQNTQLRLISACAINEKCWRRGGGGHKGCTDMSHPCLLTAENPFTCQELSLTKATLDFFWPWKWTLGGFS